MQAIKEEISQEVVRVEISMDLAANMKVYDNILEIFEEKKIKDLSENPIFR